jgi:hypothetical protein
MKKILYFLLIVVGCKQNNEFKGGRVFEVSSKVDTLNSSADSLFDSETKTRLDSIKTSLLDSFRTNNKRIKIGPTVRTE